MHFLEQYYNYIVKQDLINKFHYNSSYEIPKIKKIVLNFECKDLKIKTFLSALVTLELISTKPAKLTYTKNSHIFLKIQKGQLAGCKVVLEKKYMYQFLEKTLTNIIPKLKSSLKIKDISKTKDSFSFILPNNLLNFPEVQEHFNLMNKVPNLHITLVTSARTNYELVFLLKSFKFPIKGKRLLFFLDKWLSGLKR